VSAAVAPTGLLALAVDPRREDELGLVLEETAAAGPWKVAVLP
jgi:hypothetical protein